MPVVPSLLTASEYDAVARNMLVGNPDLPSAAIEIGIGDRAAELRPWTYDTSFVRQMNELQTVGYVTPTLPDIYAVTRNSAVPVADSIRGYYEHLEQICPPIIGIDANSVDGYRFFHGEKQRLLTERQRVHVAQLAIAGTLGAHVCIVDQFVATGRTIAVGAELLYASGASQVSAIRGKWYTDILKPVTHADQLGLTSSHAPFMHDVGRLAAAHSFAPIN
jgi:hypothetical protein